MHPVVQPVECLYTRYNRLFNRTNNRLDNRLHRVNWVLEVYLYSVDLRTTNRACD